MLRKRIRAKTHALFHAAWFLQTAGSAVSLYHSQYHMIKTHIRCVSTSQVIYLLTGQFVIDGYSLWVLCWLGWRCEAEVIGIKKMFSWMLSQAEEAYPVDQETQASTLASAAPLNPPPETEEKPTENSDSTEPAKTEPAPPPTNGHSTPKTADTELWNNLPKSSKPGTIPTTRPTTNHLNKRKFTPRSEASPVWRRSTVGVTTTSWFQTPCLALLSLPLTVCLNKHQWSGSNIGVNVNDGDSPLTRWRLVRLEMGGRRPAVWGVCILELISTGVTAAVWCHHPGEPPP